jgi:short-subunit dehydrogenase
LALAKRGARLALGALPAEAGILDAFAAELTRDFGVVVRLFPVDLSEPDGPHRLYQAVRADIGDLDILVNNAGVIVYGDFHRQSWEKLDRLLAVNLRAYTRLMHLALPDMTARGRGWILNVVSASAFSPTPHHALYGATKAAVQALSDAVRMEIRGSGVGITTLNPAYVDTPLLKGEGFPKKLPWYRLSGLANAAWVAEKGLDAMEKGRALCTPGLRNYLSIAVLPRFTPRFLLHEIAYRVLKG